MRRGLRLLVGCLLVGLCARGASLPVDDVWKLLKGTAQPSAGWNTALPRPASAATATSIG